MEPALESALDALVSEMCPRATLPQRVALVAEHAAALRSSATTRPHTVVTRGDAVAVAVVDRTRDRAWVLGVALGDTHGAALLADLRDATRALGANDIVAAGPPWHYLVSGLGAEHATLETALARAGYAPWRHHLDLAVTALGGAHDPRVRRADPREDDALGDWIAQTFAPAWQHEALAARRAHDALFVAGAPGAYAGFAAHSGHNAALGTFGPVGVVPGARGTGLGAALTRAAFDDLAARGHASFTIPWVAPELVAFYRPLVATLEERPRRVWRATLP